MRICSLLPSGTEILFALGLGDSVVGVTFECDYPDEARGKPVVVGSKLASDLPHGDIDRTVKEFSARAESLYRLHIGKLQEIKPDLLITQDLGHVCAAAPGDLGAVLGLLSPTPCVLPLRPRTVADVWNDIVTVGEATGRAVAAQRIGFHTGISHRPSETFALFSAAACAVPGVAGTTIRRWTLGAPHGGPGGRY